MMHNRLAMAKKLLNPRDSVLICTIDEQEYLHLGCLLEEMFPSAKIQMISSIINHGTIARNNEFNRNNEYIYYVMIGNYYISPLEQSKNFSEGDIVNWRTLRRTNAKNTRQSTKNQFYPIYVNNATKKIQKIGTPIALDVNINSIKPIKGCTTVWPIRDDGTEMMWGMIPSELENRLKKGYVKVCSYYPNKPQKYSLQYLASGTIEAIDDGRVEVIGYEEDGSVKAIYNEHRMVMPKTQWDFPSHDARDYGTYMIKKFFLQQSFDFPKSLYAVFDTIRYFVNHKKNATILDFFAGSGTTFHALNLLNALDGGNRKCIMVTNNEMSYEESKVLKEKGIKEGDEEWENLGVAKHITWPRTYCSINGEDINGNKIDEFYGVEIPEYIKIDDKQNKYELKSKQVYQGMEKINIGDGFISNVKYFKCDWTPRKPQEYLLSNVLCLHIKEMIELQNAIEIDNIKNVLILSKDDYNKYINNDKKYKNIEKIWINNNIVLNSKELNLLKEKRFKYIPREFFSQELKEVAE